MERQILFSYRREEYLDLIKYLPPPPGMSRRYEVIEYYHEVSA